MDKKTTAVISLEKNAVYRVIDGELEQVDKPKDGFGEQTIYWQDGKPHRYKVSYTKR